MLTSKTCCNEKLKSLSNRTEIQKVKIEKYDKLADDFTSKTNYLNKRSMETMFIGLIVLMLYVMFIF